MQTPSTNKTLTDFITENKSVSIENNDKGLCINVETPHSRLTISLFGGHVLSFKKKRENRELLWLSDKAIFDGKTPIRGGIPICWPWFSNHNEDPSFPSHGFARTQLFKLLDIKETFSEQEVSSTQLTLAPSQLGLFGFSKLDMKLVINVSDALDINIISTNNSDSSILLTQALHTYFRVDDIENTLLKGVSTDYFDKPSNTTDNKAPNIYTFEGEVDRIHEHLHCGYTMQQTIEVLSINGANTNNTNENSETLLTTINQNGHNSTVVWNPGKEKSINMKDMDNEGFVTMLCIEAASTLKAEAPLILLPNHSHTLSQTIS